LITFKKNKKRAPYWGFLFVIGLRARQNEEKVVIHDLGFVIKRYEITT
jgi:hypothetical protein